MKSGSTTNWPTRKLPQNLSPLGTRCIQITIPDDDEWERAMYAEVVTLAQWFRWQRDIGKNGKPVAGIWLKALKTWRHCDGTPSPINGMEVDDLMPLRVDCDCNVFVTCCDGIEKQIFTADQVKAIAGGQPGPGTPIPGPGGCQTYHATVEAGRSWLLPTLVNTGDVITPSNFNGATTDLAPLGRWNCYDGEVFQLGACQGNKVFEGTAPAPSLYYGQILITINGVYYDATNPVTVPGGISNQPAALLINYPTGGDFAGSLTLDVEICNNQTATFSHIFDFTATPGGWAQHLISEGPGCTAAGAVYTSGVGWTLFACPSIGAQYINISIAFSARTLSHAEYSFHMSETNPPSSAIQIFYDHGGTEVLETTSSPPWTDPFTIVSTPTGAVQGVRIRVGIDDLTDAMALFHAVIAGVGSDPF